MNVPSRDRAQLVPGIVVRAVSKRRGDIQALDDVTLEVARGEIVGLVGRNGSGKTTLLHVLAGVLSPDEGSVTIAEARSQAEIRTRVGFAPQALAIYGRLTVEENLTFFGRAHRLRGEPLRVAVASALVRADLEDRRGARAQTLSGGMQRRLHVACAILHAPPVVLLDEPTVGVDARSRTLIFDTLRALRHAASALLLSTHHLDEASEICDRLITLERGRLVPTDRPNDAGTAT